LKVDRVLPYAVNRLWTQTCSAGHSRFLNSLKTPRSVQEQYLQKLLQNNSSTRYGKSHRFPNVSSVRDFQRIVPLTRYEDYLPYIEDIALGKSSVLTHERVILFQPTSGTTSASKLIPYTASLKREYQRAVAPWIYHLYGRVPGLTEGRAYWSISPEVEREKFSGCIPVGFASDSEYLGGPGRMLYNLVTVGQGKFPPGISTDDFWDTTLLDLLSAGDLALISVWSPTFLLILVKRLTENWLKIICRLEGSDIKGAHTRAGEIRHILEVQGIKFAAIWPNLKVISCWTHGTSENYIDEIRRYFPGVEIEGKGLVATEAFVSLPFLAGKDPLLAVNSHFFEFRDMENGKIFLAHDLREGGVYSVVVTTGGGLYRYELDDIVRVTGFAGGTPAIRFISKNSVSDLFGEKLNAEHVARSTATAFAECGIEPGFALVSPFRSTDGKPCYSISFRHDKKADENARLLSQKLEHLLLENFHYAYCRRLGQLGPLRVFIIEDEAPELVFLEEMVIRGQKIGEVKPSILDRQFGWEKRFKGHFVDA